MIQLQAFNKGSENMYNPDTSVTKTVTISAAGTVSTVLDKRYHKFMAIFLPSNWTTSTITFQGCDTLNGTFTEIVKASDVGAITIASVAASKCITLDGTVMDSMVAVPFIKLVAGTTQATTDKIINIVLAR